jgi:uncharacterized Zn finger protein
MSKAKKEPPPEVFEGRITRKALQNLAGARSFERGEDYFYDGSVGRLVEHDGKVTASVQGTRKYVVKLWVEGGRLSFDCTCPVGDDGLFCKHCVAVGLAWIDLHEGTGPKGGRSKKPPLTMEALQGYLEGQDVNALVAIVMDQALSDEDFREKLFMRMASWQATKNKRPLDTEPFLSAIDRAVDVGYVPYREVYGYARSIRSAVDPIRNLIEEGHAAQAMRITEYAMEALNRAISQVDDSSGNVSDVLYDVVALHLEACKKAKPDAEKLAEWLFERQMEDDYDLFSGSLDNYAPCLGKKGMARYRALAEDAWSRVPEAVPGEEGSISYTNRYRITAIMKSFARASGNLDDLIAVMSRDLSVAYRFLDIAQTCEQHGNSDLALEWAERGLKAFPDRTDARLREFLAEQYHRKKRHDEAMELVWKQFDEAPRLETYQNLKKHADRVKTWPAWRERALHLIREQIAQLKKQEKKQRNPWAAPTDHSHLVEIFLWEKDVESAWQEAVSGGCPEALWLSLAEARAKTHPADALPIYLRQIEPMVNLKNNNAYEQAVLYLRIVRDLMKRLNRTKDFAALLTTLRTSHKPKRNFMKLLEQFH